MYWSNRRSGSVAKVVVMTCLTACSDGATDPRFEPTTLPRLASITEWSVSEPSLVQRGVFTWEGDRLTRYDFGFLREGSHFATYYVTYTYQGSTLQRADTYVRDHDPQGYFETFSHVEEAEFRYDASGRLREISSLIRLNSGTFSTSETFEYAGGRLTKARSGDSEVTVEYDSRGNVQREVHRTDDGGQLDYAFEYHDSWNPFARPMPQYYGTILVRDDLSQHLSRNNYSRFSVSEPGSPPASRGSVELEVGPDGFPTRRTTTITNTDTPEIQTRIITEFAYHP